MPSVVRTRKYCSHCWPFEATRLPIRFTTPTLLKYGFLFRLSSPSIRRAYRLFRFRTDESFCWNALEKIRKFAGITCRKRSFLDIFFFRGAAREDPLVTNRSVWRLAYFPRGNRARLAFRPSSPGRDGGVSAVPDEKKIGKQKRKKPRDVNTANRPSTTRYAERITTVTLRGGADRIKDRTVAETLRTPSSSVRHQYRGRAFVVSVSDESVGLRDAFPIVRQSRGFFRPSSTRHPERGRTARDTMSPLRALLAAHVLRAVVLAEILTPVWHRYYYYPGNHAWVLPFGSDHDYWPPPLPPSPPTPPTPCITTTNPINTTTTRALVESLTHKNNVSFHIHRKRHVIDAYDPPVGPCTKHFTRNVSGIASSHERKISDACPVGRTRSSLVVCTTSTEQISFESIEWS